jgi:hypothetical protein
VNLITQPVYSIRAVYCLHAVSVRYMPHTDCAINEPAWGDASIRSWHWTNWLILCGGAVSSWQVLRAKQMYDYRRYMWHEHFADIDTNYIFNSRMWRQAGGSGRRCVNSNTAHLSTWLWSIRSVPGVGTCLICWLCVGRGFYMRVHERLCFHCKDSVEDELHSLVVCPLYPYIISTLLM